MPPTTRPSLYLHVPFCTSACPYCDFDFVVARRVPAERYVSTLIEEWRGWRDRFRLPAPRTVHWGGGTPSKLPPEGVEALLREVFGGPVPGGVEVSLEANPRPEDRARFEGFRRAGVNRLSLGVQTFSEAGLKRLGRGHRPADVAAAFGAARAAGFENLSVDLIFGWPGQGLEEWRDDLARTVLLGPEHVSAYGLTIEPGTPFARLQARGKLPLPPEEVQAEMLLAARRTLAREGYEPYEISNYARPGFRSRHNLGYWTGGAYLGLGAAAHSFFPDPPPGSPHGPPPPEGARGIRWWNETDPERYMSRIEAGGSPERGVAGSERLGAGEAALEEVLLKVRLAEGFDWREMQERLGLPREETLRILEEKRLIRIEGRSLMLTEAGIILADEVVRQIL